MENIATTDPRETLARLRSLLAALIAAAYVLLKPEPATDAAPPGIGHDAWSARFAAIDTALDSAATYWTTSPTPQDIAPEVDLLPLADDLADIWRDLRPPPSTSSPQAPNPPTSCGNGDSPSTHTGACTPSKHSALSVGGKSRGATSSRSADAGPAIRTHTTTAPSTTWLRSIWSASER
ncbi:hypothetical protein J0911_15220 [Myceligenerans salitolerans]|uniref:Uncharacterized protein n=1 Tax=Myceligenerans salitolerans TaxID=1230528 RepID=A0ABS3IEF6_9MICO|nr:hypothetical protein [Myceligenerans salitolerans]